jgi:hypothetical protein
MHREPEVEVIVIDEHDKQELKILKLILKELRQIARDLEFKPNVPTRYHIKQENNMAITGIIPGQTGNFSANPSGQADPTKPLTVVPVWTSSDSAAVVTPSADGLTASVAVDAGAPQGGSFQLSVSNPDGSALNTVVVPYDNVPVTDNIPTAFAIDQTS